MAVPVVTHTNLLRRITFGNIRNFNSIILERGIIIPLEINNYYESNI